MDKNEERKRLRTRNLVVGGILAAIVILFYLITLAKLNVGLV